MSIIRRYIPGQVRNAGGSNVLLRCPFHAGGREHKPSFSIDTESGLFHCFTGGCIASVGGGLERLLKLLNLPPAMINVELQYLKPKLDRARELHKAEKDHFHSDKDPFLSEHILPESMLGVFGHEPTPLIQRGFNRDLLAKMQIGFDTRQRRIMYPIRDVYGNLAGFVGGAADKTQSPKYLVYKGAWKDPAGRQHPGHYGPWFDEAFPGYDFENHDYLWNWNNVWKRSMSDPSARVHIVEGYKAGLWMIQNGFELTIALMGSYVSEKQQRLLHRLGGTVVLCTDNDGPGRRANRKIGEILWAPMAGRVEAITYPPVDEDTQPDDYPPDQLRRVIGTARPIIEVLTGINGQTM